MPDTLRAWLTAALAGRPLPPSPDPEDVISAARDDGVLCLLDWQLARHPQRDAVPSPLRQGLLAAARADALAALELLAEQRRVFAVLQDAGVPFLVIKGGALAHWLYASPHLRTLTDLDLLLPERAAVDALEPLLAGLGYAAVVINPVANERSFRKPGGPFGHFTVDAHWRLFNRNLLKDDFGFAELHAESRELPGCGARGLSPRHALFNAVGHRALSLPHRHLHGIQRADSLRWLWDIHALLAGFDAGDWQQLQALARDKGWSALLHEAVLKVQSEFATKVPDGVAETLQAQARSEPMQMRWFASLPRYQWREFLASDVSWRGRCRWLWRRVWPDPAWVRHYYGAQTALAWPQRLLAGVRRLLS